MSWWEPISPRRKSLRVHADVKQPSAESPAKQGSSGKIGFPHVISWGYNPTVTSGMFWHSCNSCDCISSCTRSFHQRGDHEGCCEVYAPDVNSRDDVSASGLFTSRQL